MSTSPPRFQGFSITTGDREASVAFYRALGFRVQEDQYGGGRSCVDAPNQHFDIDDAEAVPRWNEGSRGPGIVLGLEVDRREDVDDLVDRLGALGHRIQQTAYDAPWGRRFAVVEDPDGNAVALMSAS